MPRRKTTPIAADRPLLQWGMGLLGLVVTLAAAGVVAREALQDRQPARLDARVVSVSSFPDGSIAEVEVRNRGAEAAAGVTIAPLSGSGGSQTVLDYVPGHGQATAHVRLGPGADPQVVVTGWSDP